MQRESGGVCTSQTQKAISKEIGLGPTVQCSLVNIQSSENVRVTNAWSARPLHYIWPFQKAAFIIVPLTFNLTEPFS